MLGIDIIVYLILYIYLDQVLPDDTGVKKSWLFCLRKKKQSYKGGLEEGLLPDEGSADHSSAIYHEPFKNKDNLARTVQVVKLKKIFKDFTAVDQISFPAYEKQIMCLLGHNGAGKTTTISMLTGLLEPDGGDIFYAGKSMFDDLEESRNKIGLCM